jgi:hypothetical protein
MADPNVAMSPEQFKQLLKSLNNQSAPSVAGAPSSMASFNTALGDAAKSVDPLKMAMGGAGEASKKAQEGFDKLQKGVEENLGVFRDLSKSGASFSNDVVGMSVAAANTRMNLGEFADVIKNNAADMAGLGGNVTRGAEAFAKFSKEMFDSRATDSLKQIGYTNKELNEVLALQIGFGRASIRDDEASRARTIRSATELATEMDMMAKLTGKSREEQMEASKKAQADMAVEAKMRLIGIKEGPEAEARARENFAKQYNEAQLRGQGQMFKEVFATGNIMSKEAGMQVALQGKAALATIEQGRALAAGNIEKANQASVRAQEETLKNQSNVALLNLSTVAAAGSDASKVVQENMTANRTLYDGVQKQLQGGAKDTSEALKNMKADATQAQAGQRKDDKGQYQEVDGATKAVIQLGNRAGDVTSALATQLIDPLNKTIGPSLGEFANKYLSGVITTRDKEGRVTGQENFATALEKELKKGYEKGASDAPVSSGKPSSWKGKVTENESFSGAQALQSIGEIAGNIGKITATTIDSITIGGTPIPGRSSGSLGETGSLLENFGSGTLAMLHGKEAVLTEDQLNNLALGSKASGVESAVNNLKSSIDLSKVSKDITTTVSSVSGGGETVSRRTQSNASKEAEAELAKLKEKYQQDRNEIRDKIKAELGPDAKFADVMKKMRESVDAQNLSETYHKKQEELQKAIDDGINYEIESKKSVVEETKQIAQEVAETSKDIIGKSVIGMSDEEIEKMLPDGSAIEDYFVDMEGKLQSFANSKTARDLESTMSENIPTSYKELSSATGPTGINIDNIDFGPNGLPIFKQVKAKAAEVPAAIKDNESKAEEARLKRQAEQTTAQKPAETKPSEGPAKTTDKQATLNDVVGSLNSLNKLMGQLIGQNDELLNKQIKATKSSSQNIFAR